jgi:hypothetical protein
MYWFSTSAFKIDLRRYNVWKLNVAHTFFMQSLSQDNKYKEAGPLLVCLYCTGVPTIAHVNNALSGSFSPRLIPLLLVA